MIARAPDSCCANCAMPLHDFNVARREPRPGVAGRPARLDAYGRRWCLWCAEEHDATDFDALVEGSKVVETEEDTRAFEDLRRRRARGLRLALKLVDLTEEDTRVLEDIRQNHMKRSPT